MKCMKYVAMMVMLVAIGCTPSLYAQSNDVDLMIAEAWTLTGTVRTNIPFAFSVADKKFEPGSYSISRNGEKAITIQEASTKAVVVVLTNAVSVAPNGSAIVCATVNCVLTPALVAWLLPMWRNEPMPPMPS